MVSQRLIVAEALLFECDAKQAGDGSTRIRWIQDFEMKPNAPFTAEQMATRINLASEHNLRTHKRVIEQHWRENDHG